MPLPLIAAAVGAVGAGVSGAIQSSRGAKQAREAQSEINAFQRQDLTNFADQLKVRTEAQDFQAEQSDQSLANVLDTLSQGGSFESATSLINSSLRAKKDIAATIQEQRNRIDQTRVQENQSIRSIQEARDNADLAGLGAKLQYGNQQRAQGQAAIGSAFGTLAKGAISAAGAEGGLFGKGKGAGAGAGADAGSTRAVQETASAISPITGNGSTGGITTSNLASGPLSSLATSSTQKNLLQPSVIVGEGSFGGIFDQGNYVAPDSTWSY